MQACVQGSKLLPEAGARALAKLRVKTSDSVKNTVRLENEENRIWIGDFQMKAGDVLEEDAPETASTSRDFFSLRILEFAVLVRLGKAS